MTNESGANRWWESYLVRYLMPSIAGVAIVTWLTNISDSGLRQLLWLPRPTQSLDTPVLVLLFLYGNLFCYVASYPVLCFHATRVLDFRDGEWPSYWYRDGYLVTLAVGVAVLLVSLFFE